MPQFAKARDANEKDIVKALRSDGWSVARLNPVDRADAGLPDLLLGKRGYTTLAEVKREPGPRGGTSDKTLTEKQAEWHCLWNGAAPLVLDCSPDEAVKRASEWLQWQHDQLENNCR